MRHPAVRRMAEDGSGRQARQRRLSAEHMAKACRTRERGCCNAAPLFRSQPPPGYCGRGACPHGRLSPVLDVYQVRLGSSTALRRLPHIQGARDTYGNYRIRVGISGRTTLLLMERRLQHTCGAIAHVGRLLSVRRMTGSSERSISPRFPGAVAATSACRRRASAINRATSTRRHRGANGSR